MSERKFPLRFAVRISDVPNRHSPFKLGFYCLLFVILISSLIPHSAYATVIRLRNQATPSSTLISLGDIADILETDELTATQLKRITIAPAPAMGRSLKINIDRIRRELTLRGINQTDITFSGSSESIIEHKVKTKKRNSTPQIHQVKKIEQALNSMIRNYIRSRAPELGIVLVELNTERLRAISLQANLVNTAKISGGRAPWTGMQNFQVSFINQQGQPQNIELTCTVSMKQQVFALKLGLPRGKVIRDDDLILIEPGNTSSAQFYFTKREELVGTETIRNIRAQRPIQPEDIRQHR